MAELTEIHRFGSMPPQGGTITMPPADQFWSDYIGSLTDRLGINWIVRWVTTFQVEDGFPDHLRDFVLFDQRD